MKARSVFVAGTGAFGTTLALIAARNGHRVALWGRDPHKVADLRRTRCNAALLPDIIIPESVHLTADPGDAASADVFLCGVPTAYLASALAPFPSILPRGTPILSLTKGIDIARGERPSQLLTALFRGHPVAVLSGPSHAEEVAREIPSSVVLAAIEPSVATELQALFTTERFRIYTHFDVIGVEIAGALKNVISIAAGICDGQGFGDNTKAALVTRGLVEMARLGEALGAQRETFAGLAGMGDLITSAFSRHGRNRHVGERLGRGETLAAITASMEQVAEGVRTAHAAVGLAERHGVEMPITRQVFEILYEGKDPAAALRALMSRARKAEIA